MSRRYSSPMALAWVSGAFVNTFWGCRCTYLGVKQRTIQNASWDILVCRILRSSSNAAASRLSILLRRVAWEDGQFI
jgi:hypothetical protein